MKKNKASSLLNLKNRGGHMFLKDIPNLKMNVRDREYKLYSENLRDKVAYKYLFESKTHRELDKEVLELDAIQSRGFQSMGILQHIGLKGEYRGFFEGLNLLDVIVELEKKDETFANLVLILKRVQQSSAVEDELTETVENDVIAEKAEEEQYYSEGEIKTYFGKRYERNPQNRKKAILIHGTTCSVCSFNFEEFYGAHGKDFIEVHHLEPISTFEQQRIIDPQTDLAPVCSNCHRMLHRNKNQVLSIEELRTIIKKV